MDLPLTALSVSVLLLCTTFTLIIDELVRVSTSSQTTTVPFTTLVAGLINNLDISGRLFGGEILEKVNEVLLTVIVCTGIDCSNELRGCSKVISSGGIKVINHSRPLPGTVHVNSSSSPLHTGATSGGLKITVSDVDNVTMMIINIPVKLILW